MGFSMNANEQKSFVKAYGQNVAHHSKEYVADFVARYYAREDMDYCTEQISIVDALGIWNSAIRWQLQQMQSELA
jgi:hypothetical protein